MKKDVGIRSSSGVNLVHLYRATYARGRRNYLYKASLPRDRVHHTLLIADARIDEPPYNTRNDPSSSLTSACSRLQGLAYYKVSNNRPIRIWLFIYSRIKMMSKTKQKHKTKKKSKQKAANHQFFRPLKKDTFFKRSGNLKKIYKMELN